MDHMVAVMPVSVADCHAPGIAPMGLSFPGIRVHSLSHSEVTDKPSLHRHLEHKPSLGIRPPKKAKGLFHTEPYQFLQGPI